MIPVIALVVLSVIAFALVGILLGIFRMGKILSDMLTAVADLIPFYDDEDEEEYVPPLDDVGYDIDEDTDHLFIEIAKQLDKLDQLGDKLAEEGY